jgi:hypothetical protein
MHQVEVARQIAEIVFVWNRLTPYQRTFYSVLFASLAYCTRTIKLVRAKSVVYRIALSLFPRSLPER